MCAVGTTCLEVLVHGPAQRLRSEAPRKVYPLLKSVMLHVAFSRERR
jgi:hypothetical protein